MPVPRLEAIRRLLNQLEGQRSHLTPAEYFRDASFIAGWTIKRGRSGHWSVQSPGFAEQEVKRDTLLTILQNDWAPEARAALSAETP